VKKIRHNILDGWANLSVFIRNNLVGFIVLIAFMFVFLMLKNYFPVLQNYMRIRLIYAYVGMLAILILNLETKFFLKLSIAFLGLVVLALIFNNTNAADLISTYFLITFALGIVASPILLGLKNKWLGV
jgi:magnesium-transporting ATPase (P-type)